MKTRNLGDVVQHAARAASLVPVLLVEAWTGGRVILLGKEVAVRLQPSKNEIFLIVVVIIKWVIASIIVNFQLC
jgi:hypothetical protein